VTNGWSGFGRTTPAIAVVNDSGIPLAAYVADTTRHANVMVGVDSKGYIGLGINTEPFQDRTDSTGFLTGHDE
jgi:hypothetical protein